LITIDGRSAAATEDAKSAVVSAVATTETNPENLILRNLLVLYRKAKSNDSVRMIQQSLKNGRLISARARETKRERERGG